ncbi:MAG: tellurite resistance/C4-dicarboxylate transporter family protein, partial [Casimicrobiaceae bacterium]
HDDIVDHLHAQGFFTLVAGSSLLGSQFVVLAGDDRIGAGLLVVTVILWVGFTYTIFAALTIKEHKPTLDQGISGGWLLAVVATQSIAVLAALLAARFGQPYKEMLNFFSLSMWMWGGMLYIWLMSLIFYRYAFFRFFPGDLAPPYWINMGAMAISTLAGALLIVNAPDVPFLVSLLPFIKGFTVLYWATGTWWIPMLVVLAIWRHVYKRFPLAYDPLYWSIVFPLGMYSASTHEMRHAMRFDFLDFIPPTFFAIALLAWTVTLVGLVTSLARRYRPRVAIE